jgi:hypothetical protein
MTINWKIVAIFAVFAFFVAFITGGFSGVGFFDLILRALVWAILFGALGLGILIVVNRFLPDLAEVFSSDNTVKKSMSRGEVDILLPDENPHKSGNNKDFIDDLSDDEPGSAGEMHMAGDDSDNSMEDDMIEDGIVEKIGKSTTNGTNGIMSESDEIDAEDMNYADSDETGSEYDNNDSVGEKYNRENDEEVSDELYEDKAREIPPKDKKEKNKQKGKSRAENLETLEEIGDDSFSENMELDSLPDLDKFSGSFSSFDDFDASTSEGTVFKSKDNVDISGVKQDPSKVAKAIHTWIAKDKEG